MLKVYLPDFEPDLEALQRCSQLNSPQLVSLWEAGRAGSYVYELMEYSGAETLADLLNEHPEGLPTDMVRAIVGQLTSALTELHRHGVAHLDVKPANILLRSREGPEIALADYGAAAPVQQPVEFRPSLRTVEYAAPEVFVNAISLGCDWWSLGVVAAELAAGRHPFAGVSEDNIILQVVQGVVPIPADIDRSVQLLCEGLIANQLAVRWGAEQVTRWLADEALPAPPERGPQSANRTPFVFDGVAYTERTPLAAALGMRGNWGKATRSLFEPIDERWFELRDWLAQFDDPGERTSSRDMAVRLEQEQMPPDVALLLLLRWMDPGAPATYRGGYQVRLSLLPTVAELAAAGDPLSARLVTDFWEHRLLPELDQAPDGHGLAQADAQWRWLAGAWDRASASLRVDRPDTAAALAAWQGLGLGAHLLWLAADPGADNRVRDWLADAQRAIRQDLGGGRGGLDWFDEIVAGSANPAARLVAYAVSPLARSQAQQIRIRRQAVRAEYTARVRNWHRREQWRALDRPIAAGWAAAGMGILALGWMVLLVLSSATGIASSASINRAWMFMVTAIALQTGAELWLAMIIGAPYHPDYSLMMGMGRAAGVTGRRFMHQGLIGFAVVSLTTTALLATTIFVPFLLPLMLVPAHAGWVHARHARWHQDYQRSRAAALRRPSQHGAPAPDGQAGGTR
jgi:hypothetical protein